MTPGTPQSVIKVLTAKQEQHVEALKNTFVEKLGVGVSAWIAAGKALCELVRISPEEVEVVRLKCGLSRQLINSFIDIGSGALLPDLLTAPEWAKKLPIRDQEVLLKGQVDAIVMRPDGKTEIIKVDLLRADPKMRKQVVGEDGLLSPGEQKAKLVAEANARSQQQDKEAAVLTPYVIEGKGSKKHVRFLRACLVNEEELRDILRKLV